MKKETEKLIKATYHDYAEEKVINPLMKTEKNTWKQGHSHLETENLPYPFIHSSFNRYLGCFYVLDIVNIAAVNMRVHLSFSKLMFISFHFFTFKIMCRTISSSKAGCLLRVSIRSVGFDSHNQRCQLQLYNL